MEQGRDLVDGAAIDPPVLPESSALAVTDDRVGAREKEGAFLSRKLEVELSPCTAVISFAEP